MTDAAIAQTPRATTTVAEAASNDAFASCELISELYRAVPP
jgi:hypothetical protein